MAGPGRPKISRNAHLNKDAWQKMSRCQRETGKTAVQLAAMQYHLREQFYSRQQIQVYA